jgi:hypothetical protein
VVTGGTLMADHVAEAVKPRKNRVNEKEKRFFTDLK